MPLSTALCYLYKRPPFSISLKSCTLRRWHAFLLVQHIKCFSSQKSPAPTKPCSAVVRSVENYHHTSKTSNIFFSKKGISKPPKPKIKNSTLNWSIFIKYFGVQIDNTLKFNEHVQTAVNKTKAIGYKLFLLFNSKSPLFINIKLYIYKSYMRPILTYGSPVWESSLNIKHFIIK